MQKIPSHRRHRQALCAAVSVAALVSGALAAPGAAFAATPAAAGCAWSVRDLPLLPGTTNHTGRALGSDGAATYAGYSWTDDGQHAVLWRDGRVVDLGHLRDGFTRADDVNRDGVAVGSTDIYDNPFAMVWRDRVPSALESPEGTSSSEAYAVNDAGLAVGYRTTRDGEVLGVVWSTRTLEIVREYPGVYLSDTGEDNRVVGTTSGLDSSRAVKSRPGRTAVVAYRPPAGGGSTSAAATAGVHTAGVQVSPSTGAWSPVLWTSGRPRVLAAAGSANVKDVNAGGTVVGEVQVEGRQRPRVWAAGTSSPVALPSRGLQGLAETVSADGRRIAGSVGSNDDGVAERPVVWTCAAGA